MSVGRRLAQMEKNLNVCPRCGRGGEPAQHDGINLLHEALRHPEYLEYLEQRALEEDRGKPIEVDTTDADANEPRSEA